MSISVPSSIVAFYAHKGGTGKSTCCFCFACDAVAKGLKVLLIAADPQGDTARWAMGSNKRQRQHTYLSSDLGFTALYVDTVPPHEELERFLTDYDLIVIDMPPYPESILSVNPDLWVVPIANSDSLLNTAPLLRNMKLKGGRIGFLPNNIGAGNDASARIINGINSLIVNEPSTFLLSEIPKTESLSRVAEEHQPPWQVSNSSEVDRGVIAMRKASMSILRVLSGLPVTTAVSKKRSTPALLKDDSQAEEEQARQRNIVFWTEMSKFAKKGLKGFK